MIFKEGIMSKIKKFLNNGWWVLPVLIIFGIIAPAMLSPKLIQKCIISSAIAVFFSIIIVAYNKVFTNQDKKGNKKKELTFWDCVSNYVLKAFNWERASRREFWVGFLLCFSINFILAKSQMHYSILIGWILLNAVPLFTVSARRLHDINMSGGWAILIFVPIACIFNYIIGLIPSQVTANKYGKPLIYENEKNKNKNTDINKQSKSNTKKIKQSILPIFYMVIGILLGFFIYTGIEYYKEYNKNKVYTEKIYSYIFDNEKQVEKDCLNKYIKKGEITTLTNVITTHYICKCLPHELRIMVNNKDIKKSFENMKASNNKEIREITKDFLMDTASIICKTEIEQLGMIEIQKKYGKLDIH